MGLHTDASVLIEIFLWEIAVDSAWETAQTEDCSDTLWLRVAKVREDSHPADSLKVYQRLLPPMIEPVTNGQYEAPVALIERIQGVMKRLGLDNEFDDYIAELRTNFKRKRNFIQLLKMRGL